MAGALAAGIALFVLAPGPLHNQPSETLAQPRGTVVGAEPMRDAPGGSRAWRIRYLSRSYTSSPTALTGLIFVPAGPPPAGGRHVVALTHGTAGVAPGCAVSLRSPKEQAALLEGLGAFLRAGDVVVAPDYQGLGTPGPHPYLVGDAEASATLDAVRAAHNFRAAHAGAAFAVWGHSQGGHAALFIGQEAAAYAPELHLVGVAAGAPASNLRAIFKLTRNTSAGRLLSAYVLATWSRVYHRTLRLRQVVTSAARPVVRRLARTCIALDTSTNIRTGALTSLLGMSYLRKAPWTTKPWKTFLHRNTPGNRFIPVPVLVTQGTADELVRPGMTTALVHRLCKRTDIVYYRRLPGIDHVDGGNAAVPLVTRWIADRFAGVHPPNTCGKAYTNVLQKLAG